MQWFTTFLVKCDALVYQNNNLTIHEEIDCYVYNIFVTHCYVYNNFVTQNAQPNEVLFCGYTYPKTVVSVWPYPLGDRIVRVVELPQGGHHASCHTCNRPLLASAIGGGRPCDER